MNKIYKVVWSKVKNCYVVVSEVAKANGKSGVKTIATVAAAAILMSGGTAMAAELTVDYDNGTYTATGTGIQGSLEMKQDGLYSGLTDANWAGTLNTYNNSVHEWNGNTSAYGGGFGENESSSENVLKVHGGDFDKRIIAGYSNSGDANGNALYFNGSTSVNGEYIKDTHTLTNKIVGGWGMNNASNNNVYVKDAVLNAGIDGGDAQKGNAEGNVIEIDGSTVTYVAAGTARYENGNGNTINNKVIITNSIDNNTSAGIWGGCTNGYGDAVGNSVNISESQIKAYVVGGHSSYGDAYNNEVVVDGASTTTNLIFGGRAQYGESKANNNTVTINNGTINGKVFGGAGNGVEGAGDPNATYSEANGNVVNITGGTFAKEVYGGNNEKIGVANENTVTISGGTINNNVYGGYANTAANKNAVTIKGGSVAGNVYGGYVKNGEANDNIVTIAGTANVENANIYGSNISDSTGNTLNVTDGWNGTAKSIENFDAFNVSNKAYFKVIDAYDYEDVDITVDDATLELGEGVAVEKLTFNNGGIWNVTEDSTVTTLAGNGAKLVNGSENDVVEVTVNKPGTNSAMVGTVVDIGEGVALNISSDDGTGNGIVRDVNITGEGDLNITSDNALFGLGYGENSIDVDQLKIELTNGSAWGTVYSDNNSTGDHVVKANDAQLISGNDAVHNQGPHNIIIDVENQLDVVGEDGYAVLNASKDGGTIDLTAKTINLTSNDRSAVKVGHEVGDKGYNGTVNIGDADTETITIKAAAQNPDPKNKNERKGSAVYAQAGTVNLSATDTITIQDTAKAGGNAIGAYGGVVNVKDAANVVIDGKIYATGEGSQVNITTTGDVTVNDAGVSMSSSEEDALAFATNKGAITITGNNENTITLTGGGGDWENGKSQAIAAAYGGTSTVKDFKEVVFAGEHAHSGFYAFAGGTTVVENIGTIKQAEGSSIGQAFNAFGGNLTVKADAIELDNVGNGIFAQSAGANDGVIKVEATTIDISGAGGLIAGRKMNKGTGTTDVYVEADDITLVADVNGAAINCNNNYNGVNYNDDNVTTVVAHNKLSITGSRAVNANHGLEDGFVTVNLTAKEMEIINNGDYDALRANDYAQINVNASDKLSISGEVESTANSEININANAVFNDDTSFNADGTSKINLTGGEMSGTLNIVEGTQVHLTGATFTAEDLDTAVVGGALVLDGSGVLKTTAAEVFADADTTKTEDFNNDVIDRDNIVYKAGAVSLAEDYSYEYLSDALDTMKAHQYDGTNASATKIIMTGDLKTSVEDIGGEDNTITADQASGLGNDVELDKVTVDAGKNLLVGANVSDGTEVEGMEIEDSVANGFSANELNLAADSDGAVITGGQEVTLGGSEGNSNLVSAEGSDSVKVVVGAEVDGVADSSATLNIGNSGATEDTEYNLNGSITINDGSELNTKGQTTITEGVTVDGGTINVEQGALQADIIASGESTITGNVSGELTADADAVINVGTTDKTASTSFDNVNLNGAVLGFDPAWDQPAGNHGLAFAGEINGSVQIARNNYIALGTNDTTAAKAMFDKTGLTFGENDITAALYIKGSQTLSDVADYKASIYVDGSQQTGTFVASPVAGTFSAAANSVTMVDANTATASLSGVTNASIDADAKLYIDEAVADQTYKVLAGVDNGWADDNIITNNQLIKFTAETSSNSAFDVTAELKTVEDVYGDDVIIADVVDEAVSTSGTNAYDFFNATVNDKVNASKEAQVDAMNSAGSVNELAGVAHTTYAVSNILTDTVADHISLANAEKHGKDVWAYYVHSREDIDGLKGAGEYDAQYNGVVVGADLYKDGKATVGAAFTYVDGNINGATLAARTENDATYYGASIYGSIENDDSAVIADVSYLRGEHDITQYNSGKFITGKPDSDAFSVGVRVEKESEAGVGKLVPYAGMRYMNLGTDSYTNSIGLKYSSDDAELFLLPVGLKYSADIKQGNGWTVRPIAEIGYVWAFGDTDTNQTVSLNGASNGFGYDVTDNGSYVGRLMIEAEKDNFSYALGYEYQKGDSVKTNKWMANVNWKF